MNYCSNSRYMTKISTYFLLSIITHQALAFTYNCSTCIWITLGTYVNYYDLAAAAPIASNLRRKYALRRDELADEIALCNQFVTTKDIASWHARLCSRKLIYEYIQHSKAVWQFALTVRTNVWQQRTMWIGDDRRRRLRNSTSRHKLEEINAAFRITVEALQFFALAQFRLDFLIYHKMHNSFSDAVVGRCDSTVKSSNTSTRIRVFNTL